MAQTATPLVLLSNVDTIETLSPLVTARPIRPDDADRLRRLYPRLSTDTLYRRFFTVVGPPNDRTLRYLAEVDGHRREAVVALVDDDIIGVARFDRDAERPELAEAAVLVEDAWQGSGVGSFLMERLAHRAAEEGISAFTATALAANQAPIRLARHLAPLVEVAFDGTEVELLIPLPRIATSTRSFHAA